MWPLFNNKKPGCSSTMSPKEYPLSFAMIEVSLDVRVSDVKQPPLVL